MIYLLCYCTLCTHTKCILVQCRQNGSSALVSLNLTHFLLSSCHSNCLRRDSSHQTHFARALPSRKTKQSASFIQVICILSLFFLLCHSVSTVNDAHDYSHPPHPSSYKAFLSALLLFHLYHHRLFCFATLKH